MKFRWKALVLIAAVAAACTAQPSTPPLGTQTSDSLLVQNLDGPTVEIVLGTESIGVVPCLGLRRFSPGPGLPSWPWHLTVRAVDGGSINGGSHAEVDVGIAPGGWRLLVRGRSISVGLGQDGPVGPVAATCPPAPLASS
jgi:hypothetical protein